MKMRLNRRVLVWGRLPLIVGWLALAYLFVRALPLLPSSPDARRELALAHLAELRHEVREQNAAKRMQRLFPEGGCFTITLYGLAWTNVALHFDVRTDVRDAAVKEALWALKQYHEPYVVAPFVSTQVNNGVFWLGQRNLLLGQTLKALPIASRPPALVAEFHEHSKSLAEAFLASPTAHIDTYPYQCWPADNMTALASLLVHDELYGSDYRQAFTHWKQWTAANADPITGMPAGHLSAQTGELYQPARGCANSWMLALLSQMDPAYARDLYQSYREHFRITRLGISMFREYPRSKTFPADVDSGPIVLGAGVAATGIGLAASLANGDLQTAQDIYGLAAGFGIKRSTTRGGQPASQYLFGRLPVGQAFLAWAHSLPVAAEMSAAPTARAVLIARAVPLLLYSMVVLLYGYCWRRAGKESRAEDTKQ